MPDLEKFNQEIIELYNRGCIRGPIHLSGGNEIPLRKIFRSYKGGDWIFSTWRNHWHWLLSGRDPEELKQFILKNHSMHVFDEKFFTSSIAAGCAPIALGVAYALKLKKSKNKVLCFLGDMAATMGLSQECFRFALGHSLPIKYLIEDNGLSITTPTEKVWGKKQKKVCFKYFYKRKQPHAGTGKFIPF